MVYENDFINEKIHFEFYPKLFHIDIFTHVAGDTSKDQYFTIRLTKEETERLLEVIEITEESQ